VVAQRLARTLCSHCKRSIELPKSVRIKQGLEDAELFEPVGCIRCSNSGYHGRVGLYEVMPMSDEIRSLILDRRGVNEIAASAVAAGMRTMRQDGIEKVKQGLTTLAEVARVTAI
jgi:type IV pilus assembly protein PilB